MSGISNVANTPLDQSVAYSAPTHERSAVAPAAVAPVDPVTVSATAQHMLASDATQHLSTPPHSAAQNTGALYNMLSNIPPTNHIEAYAELVELVQGPQFVALLANFPSVPPAP